MSLGAKIGAYHEKLSAWAWLTWRWTMRLASVVVAWLTKVAVMLCWSALMVEVWRWAVSLATVVVVMIMARSALVARRLVWAYVAWWAVARRHVDMYIHLAWSALYCAIYIVCHCTADCHC